MDSSGRDVQSTTYFRSDVGDNNSTSRNITRARTRSALRSVPVSYQDEQNTPTQSGALVIQMSGPLSSNSNNEFVFNPPQVHEATSNGTNSEPRITKAVVRRWNGFFIFIIGLFCLLLLMAFHFVLSVEQDEKCIMWNVDMITKEYILLRRMAVFMLVFSAVLEFCLDALAPEPRYKGAIRFIFLPSIVIFVYTAIEVEMISLNDIRSQDARSFLEFAKQISWLPGLMFILLALDDLLKRTDSGLSLTEHDLRAYDYVANLLYSYVLLCYWWYLLGLERVQSCFIDACHHSNITNNCEEFVHCALRDDLKTSELAYNSSWLLWKNNEDATACSLAQGSFDFGIFQKAVKLTTHPSLFTRYAYSLFWGLQQMMSLATNLVPSSDTAEVIFVMGILMYGLILYVLVIPSMQNILQSLGRRNLEMTLRLRDIEQWMRRRHLPEELRSHVRDAERFNWAATRGVKEEMLMMNLPEDLQRDIRRHICQFILNVPILQGLDGPIVDAILERLKTKTYIKGSKILCQSRLIDKMVFIIEGRMESIGEDGVTAPLAEGDVCGEELLTWFLEHPSILDEDGRIIRIPGDRRLLSSRLVRCLTNVKASVLLTADLVEVANLFSRFLTRPSVQGAIRYEASYTRGRAIRRIQVSWRRRKKKNARVDVASSSSVRDQSYTS